MNVAKRMSITIPAEMEQAIVDLRKTDRFCRASYAEIIREVLSVGLNSVEKKNDIKTHSVSRTD